MKRFLDSIQSNVTASAAYIENRGQKKIRDCLMSSSNIREKHGYDADDKMDQDGGGKTLEENIKKIQSEMLVRSEESNSIFHFLDILNVPRREVNSHLFAAQKAELLELIQQLPESRKITLARYSICFLKSESLKFLPLLVMKNLSSLPDRYYDQIINSNNLADLPLHIKREIWIKHENIFLNQIRGNCDNFVRAIGPYYQSVSKSFGKNPLNDNISSSAPVVVDKHSRDNSLRELCEYVGTSNALQVYAYSLCIEENMSEHLTTGSILGVWSALMRSFCRKNFNVSASNPNILFSKLYELSVLLDRICEQFEVDIASDAISNSNYSNIDKMKFTNYTEQINSIVNFLIFIIKHQGKQLENEYKSTVLAAGFNYTNFFDELNATNDSLKESKDFSFNASRKKSEKKHAKYDSDDFTSDDEGEQVQHNSKKSKHKLDNRQKSSAINKNTEVMKGEILDTKHKGIAVIKKIFEEAIDYIKSIDSLSLFKSPVPKSVPNYYEIIEYPMDLKTAKNQINSHYTAITELPPEAKSPDSTSRKGINLNLFFSDIDRIFTNCSQFNGRDSYYGKYGTKLKSKWIAYIFEDTISKLESHIYHWNSLVAPGSNNLFFYFDKSLINTHIDCVDDSEEMSVADENLSNSANLHESENNSSYFDIDGILTPTDMENYISLKSNLSSRNQDECINKLMSLVINHLLNIEFEGIFAQPVTKSIAPDYFLVIKNPMDFGTINSKIEMNRENNEVYSYFDFTKDIELVFENCFTYNIQSSYIYTYASQLFDYWKLLRNNLEEAFKLLRFKELYNNNIKDEEGSSSAEHMDVQNKFDRANTNVIMTSEVVESQTYVQQVRNLMSDVVLKAQVEKMSRDNCISSTKKSFLFLILEVAWNFLVELDERGDFSSVGLHNGVLSIDLGSIRVKIDRNMYSTLDEFDEDVTILFSLNSRISTQRELSVIGDKYLEIWKEVYQNISKVYKELDGNINLDENRNDVSAPIAHDFSVVNEKTTEISSLPEIISGQLNDNSMKIDNLRSKSLTIVHPNKISKNFEDEMKDCFDADSSSDEDDSKKHNQIVNDEKSKANSNENNTDKIDKPSSLIDSSSSTSSISVSKADADLEVKAIDHQEIVAPVESEKKTKFKIVLSAKSSANSIIPPPSIEVSNKVDITETALNPSVEMSKIANSASSDAMDITEDKPSEANSIEESASIISPTGSNTVLKSKTATIKFTSTATSAPSDGKNHSNPNGSNKIKLKSIKKPEPSPILESYRLTLKSIDKMEKSSNGVTYIPDLILEFSEAENKSSDSNFNALLYAVHMIKDCGVQLLFKRYIVESMKRTIINILSVSSNNSGKVLSVQLPFHNKNFRLASQLSLIPFLSGERLINVDYYLLRCIFPLLIFETAKEFDTVRDITTSKISQAAKDAVNSSLLKIVNSIVSKCDELIAKGMLLVTQQSRHIKEYEGLFLKFIESIATELFFSTRSAIMNLPK